MKLAWYRQVRILTAIGIAVVVLFAVAVGPALAHPAKPAAPAAAGATLHVPTIHRVGAPLGTATVTVNGTLENFDGTPFSGASLEAFTSDWDSQGTATSDVSGHFTFTGVAAVTDGVVLVLYPDGSGLLFLGIDFSSGTITLRPGAIGVTVAHQSGPSLVDLLSGLNFVGESWLASSPGTVPAPPGTIDRACIYPQYNSACEWYGTATVVAGAQSATSISVDANQAIQVYVKGWASGAAGSKIAYEMRRWPAGYKVDISGASVYRQVASHDYGTWTSPGAALVTRTLIVPKTATPGYPYEIHSTREAVPTVDTGLDIFDDFQVCLLRSSSWTIKRGHAIVLSGIVPTSTAARQGRHPGPKKWMIVFGRTTAAGQPATWAATGWHRAARVQAGTAGYFKTSVLRPRKTTWYVVRYPGDGWNWAAFTQVIKVTVI